MDGSVDVSDDKERLATECVCVVCDGISAISSSTAGAAGGLTAGISLHPHYAVASQLLESYTRDLLAAVAELQESSEVLAAAGRWSAVIVEVTQLRAKIDSCAKSLATAALAWREDRAPFLEELAFAMYADYEDGVADDMRSRYSSLSTDDLAAAVAQVCAVFDNQAASDTNNADTLIAAVECMVHHPRGPSSPPPTPAITTCISGSKSLAQLPVLTRWMEPRALELVLRRGLLEHRTTSLIESLLLAQAHIMVYMLQMVASATVNLVAQGEVAQRAAVTAGGSLQQGVDAREEIFSHQQRIAALDILLCSVTVHPAAKTMSVRSNWLCTVATALAMHGFTRPVALQQLEGPFAALPAARRLVGPNVPPRETVMRILNACMPKFLELFVRMPMSLWAADLEHITAEVGGLVESMLVMILYPRPSGKPPSTQKARAWARARLDAMVKTKQEQHTTTLATLGRAHARRCKTEGEDIKVVDCPSTTTTTTTTAVRGLLSSHESAEKQDLACSRCGRWEVVPMPFNGVAWRLVGADCRCELSATDQRIGWEARIAVDTRQVGACDVSTTTTSAVPTLHTLPELTPRPFPAPLVPGTLFTMWLSTPPVPTSASAVPCSAPVPEPEQGPPCGRIGAATVWLRDNSTGGGDDSIDVPAVVLVDWRFGESMENTVCSLQARLSRLVTHHGLKVLRWASAWCFTTEASHAVAVRNMKGVQAWLRLENAQWPTTHGTKWADHDGTVFAPSAVQHMADAWFIKTLQGDAAARTAVAHVFETSLPDEKMGGPSTALVLATTTLFATLCGLRGSLPSDTWGEQASASEAVLVEISPSTVPSVDEKKSSSTTERWCVPANLERAPLQQCSLLLATCLGPVAQQAIRAAGSGGRSSFPGWAHSLDDATFLERIHSSMLITARLERSTAPEQIQRAHAKAWPDDTGNKTFVVAVHDLEHMWQVDPRRVSEVTDVVTQQQQAVVDRLRRDEGLSPVSNVITATPGDDPVKDHLEATPQIARREPLALEDEKHVSESPLRMVDCLHSGKLLGDAKQPPETSSSVARTKDNEPCVDDARQAQLAVVLARFAVLDEEAITGFDNNR
jgi:hypothetical protein